MLDQLLVALAKRNGGAPLRLVAYADDPRVQPALLEAVRTTPLEDLANVAQGLGVLGGPGAQEVLHARLQEALLDPRTFAPDSFHNWHAGSATTCCEALLCLNAEDQRAADALVRLMGHVCVSNQRSAVWAGAQVIERHKALRTRPLRGLRTALNALLDTPNDDLFCVLAPSLWNDERVPARISRLLKSRSLAKQQLALFAVGKVEFRAWPLLMEWASGPLDPVLALTTLGPNLRLLPEARRAEIGVRGLAHESPSIRRDAVLLLGTLGKPLAARLARQALKDEPDPALRRKLAALVKSSPNRAKPTRPRRAKRLRKHRRIKSARR
jgi:hypothetical protein